MTNKLMAYVAERLNFGPRPVLKLRRIDAPRSLETEPSNLPEWQTPQIEEAKFFVHGCGYSWWAVKKGASANFDYRAVGETAERAIQSLLTFSRAWPTRSRKRPSPEEFVVIEISSREFYGADA